MAPVPPPIRAWLDDDLYTAQDLNERITTPLNFLLGLSGAAGLDLTALGRDNGRGRLVLPYQGATGRPTAITLDRTGDAAGALILFNDAGKLSVATADGEYSPGDLASLADLAGTPAGTIYYITNQLAPGRPGQVRLGRVNPPAAKSLLVHSGLTGAAPQWQTGFSPAGVTFAYEYSTGTDGTAVRLFQEEETGAYPRGTVIIETPSFPRGGSVGVKATVVSSALTTLRSAGVNVVQQGAVLTYLGADVVGNEFSYTRTIAVAAGSTLQVVGAAGTISRVEVELVANLEVLPAALSAEG